MSLSQKARSYERALARATALKQELVAALGEGAVAAIAAAAPAKPKRLSPETREKMRQAALKRWAGKTKVKAQPAPKK